MAKRRKDKPRAKPRRGLWLIAGFKLAKGITLLALGLGAFSLLHDDVATEVTHWFEAWRVDPKNHFIHLLIRKLWSVDDRDLIKLGVGTFFYAFVMLTEGIGLALRQRWAEYFTVFATSSLVPLEVYELVQAFSVLKLLVIVVNLAIVAYLILGWRQK